jgi:hypothetical protein
MSRRPPPSSDYNVTALPTDPNTRHEELVDIFGQYVMWLRNWAISSAKTLVESIDAREKLGAILRRPYEEAAQLSDENRERAIRLANATVDGFIELFIRVLAHQGDDFSLGPKHSVRYNLVIQIVEKESGDLVHEEVINRKGRKHFGDYWGRWLNRYQPNKEPDPS